MDITYNPNKQTKKKKKDSWVYSKPIMPYNPNKQTKKKKRQLGIQ